MGELAIIDYGMGNLLSVANALAEIGHPGELVEDPDAVAGYDRVVLPGVGAFAEAIDHLRASGMAPALDSHVKAGKPLLGICLGMQLICRSSTEDGEHEGLGWVDAPVVGFPAGNGLKVPHMGWNSLHLEGEHPVFDGIESGNDVYFVHSYYVDPTAETMGAPGVLATATHGVSFAAVVAVGNVVGMQFHPEKSQRVGLKLLENFITRAG